MTRLPESFHSMASRLFNGQRRTQLLRIAVHLAEHREPLQSAIAGHDLAVIRASLAADLVHPTDMADDAAIAAAITLLGRTPWLFGPRLLPGWRRVAGVLEGSNRRKWVIGVALLAALAVAAVGLHSARLHSYAYWQETVTPIAADAALLQEKASTTIGLASKVGIVPLGASVHAESALVEINKLNANLRGLIVASTDPLILQSIFVQHPDPQEVVAHDRNVLRLARQHLKLAGEALAQADQVLMYDKKWHDLDPYAILPAGLSPQWSNEAAVMRNALNIGDLQQIEQADVRLENLARGSRIAQAAESIAAGLSAGDRAVAAPYLAIITDAVTRDELAKADPALAALIMMKNQIPLNYTLYLLSIPGEKTFVVKDDVRDASVKHHYLIVQATNEHGAQVPVDIHDSELATDMVASRFGIEVSAETFEQAQSGERDSLLLVGKKSPGTVSTVFALPVLDGRISRW